MKQYYVQFSALGLVLWSGSAFASETSHGINWWSLGSAYKDAPALGWLTITFLIFIWALARTIKKPLTLYLETRSKDIQRQIEEGQKAKMESEAKLKYYEDKLKTVGDEINRMKTSFAEQVQAEKLERERLIADLKTRILQDADDAIKSNYERSKNRLSEEVVERALLLARKTIQEQKQEEVDELLKRSFLHDLRASAREVQ